MGDRPLVERVMELEHCFIEQGVMLQKLAACVRDLSVMVEKSSKTAAKKIAKPKVKRGKTGC